MDEIVDELMGLAEIVRDKNQKAGDYRETAIERLTAFYVSGFRSPPVTPRILRSTGKMRMGQP